ncbi:MAG: phosphoribosylformylglycinamidine cyclo-ligase, partial [Phycisphaerales bacterium]|nr:phosphoribosylformylglycinamidine cyclo-ligase [Phycisphaerales bacterium]
DTVGRDLVQHCINDILVQGAWPLFFLDYVGTGRLDPEVVSALICGCADACRENGLALLGGETAEMPGLYADGDFDLVGFVVGAVRREKVLDGARVAPGHVLLGMPSSGLHTNGYSLARKILFERMGLDVGDRPEELGGVTVAEALLAPHRCYLRALWPLLNEDRLDAMAHITGGGIGGNLPRVLPEGCAAHIRRDSWTPPPIFRLIQALGVDETEMYDVFNMGVGFILVVRPAFANAVMARLNSAGETAFRIGVVRKGRRRVVWR